MRHADVKLTRGVYVDPRLLDVAGAVEALRTLALLAGTQTEGIAAKATRTDDLAAFQLAPAFAPAIAQRSPLRATPDPGASETAEREDAGAAAENVFAD
jgi:hypothetical protein